MRRRTKTLTRCAGPTPAYDRWDAERRRIRDTHAVAVSAAEASYGGHRGCPSCLNRALAEADTRRDDEIAAADAAYREATGEDPPAWS